LVKIFKSSIQRNAFVIKTTTFAFILYLSVTVIAAILIFVFSPEFSDRLSEIITITLNIADDIPVPFTREFFYYIFLNNSGHFWNPIRMLVWIPVLGPILLGLEILVNSGLIGVISVTTGIEKGIMYPIIGIVPHGIIEIPAFLLQFSCIILWQTSVTEMIVDKLRGRTLDKSKIKMDLRDALILAVVSILLFFIAALIETYVTPYLLGY
jgi:stage II sporulation protein M